MLALLVRPARHADASTDYRYEAALAETEDADLRQDLEEAIQLTKTIMSANSHLSDHQQPTIRNHYNLSFWAAPRPSSSKPDQESEAKRPSARSNQAPQSDREISFSDTGGAAQAPFAVGLMQQPLAQLDLTGSSSGVERDPPL